MFGLIEPYVGFAGYCHDVGIAWLALGVAGLLFRGLQLLIQQDAMTSIAWMSKICTDPFHDVLLYWRAPFALLRGELIDPMRHIRHASGASAEAASEAGLQEFAHEAAPDAARR